MYNSARYFPYSLCYAFFYYYFRQALLVCQRLAGFAAVREPGRRRAGR